MELTDRTKAYVEVWQELENLYWKTPQEDLGFERTREASLMLMEVFRRIGHLHKSEPATSFSYYSVMSLLTGAF